MDMEDLVGSWHLLGNPSTNEAGIDQYAVVRELQIDGVAIHINDVRQVCRSDNPDVATTPAGAETLRPTWLVDSGERKNQNAISTDNRR
jgi:hypothetical protein